MLALPAESAIIGYVIDVTSYAPGSWFGRLRGNDNIPTRIPDPDNAGVGT